MTVSYAIAMLLALPQGAALDGKAAFEKMLEKYYNAKTIKGTIEFNQTVEGVGKSTITTTVQVQQPNLLYLEQRKITGEPKTFRAICDGKTLGHTAPVFDTKRMIYTAAPETLSGLIDAFAPLMLDRQLATSLAVYSPFEVVTFTKPIKDIKFDEEVTLNGQSAWRLVADYGIGVGGPATSDKAAYTKAWFFISKSYDFLGMVYQETLQGRQGNRTVNYQITNQWIVNLTVDGSIDPGLFKIQ